MLSSHIKIHQNMYLDLVLLVNGVPLVHIPLLVQNFFFFFFFMEIEIYKEEYIKKKMVFHLCIFLSWFQNVFFMEKEILWTNGFKLKHLNDGFAYYKNSFSLHKTLIEGLESCGLLWCFYQLFGLSFWQAPIHCRGLPWLEAMFWWRNKLILAGRRVSISTFVAELFL